MGDEAIFFKTLSGDEAVRERTRLVQRNLRMVLILVDGFADVAALKRKIGDDAMVESSLAELERLGLIESIDARMARNKEHAAASVATVSSDEPVVMEPLPPEDAQPAPCEDSGGAELPVLTEVVAAVEPVREAPLTDTLTVFDEETAAKVWMIPGFSAPPEVLAPPPAPAVSPLARATAWWERLRSSRAQAREEAIYEKAYGRNEPGQTEVPAPVPEVVLDDTDELVAVEPPVPVADSDIKIGPIRRRRRIASSIGARLAAGVLGIVLLVLLVLVFFPYGSYRPDFEQRLSRALGEPVRIADVHVAFRPYPAITLAGVTVGEDEYATADAIRLLPEPASLLGVHRYRQVRVEGMRLKQGGLPRLSRWLTPASLESMAVDGLVVDKLALDLGKRAIEGLTASVQLDAQQGLAKIILGGAGDALRVEAVPGPTGLALSISATGWTLPFRPALRFDRLDAQADLVPGRLIIKGLSGQLYDGTVAGGGTLAWDEEPNLILSLEFERLLADKLVALYGGEPGLEGALGGKMRVGARAATFGGLSDAVRMEGNFQVVHGALKRIDLAEALRSAGKLEPVTGGTTRFEEFSGTFAMDDKAVRLSRLRLSSGLMQAFGQVAISRQNGTISGGGSTEMHGSATTVRATLTLFGKATDPALKAGN